jgi:hypothetical protein
MPPAVLPIAFDGDQTGALQAGQHAPEEALVDAEPVAQCGAIHAAGRVAELVEHSRFGQRMRRVEEVPLEQPQHLGPPTVERTDALDIDGGHDPSR